MNLPDNSSFTETALNVWMLWSSKWVRFLPRTMCLVVHVLLNLPDNSRMTHRSITDFRPTQSVTLFRNRFLLTAAVLHHGDQTDAGHYTTMLRVEGRGWRHIDDDTVLNNGKLVKKFVSNLENCDLLWFKKLWMYLVSVIFEISKLAVQCATIYNEYYFVKCAIKCAIRTVFASRMFEIFVLSPLCSSPWSPSNNVCRFLRINVIAIFKTRKSLSDYMKGRN